MQYLELMKQSGKTIEIMAFCLMPNHLHLLIKQKEEKGIALYMGNIINAYTKYQRTGPLFQGVFKAVHVETDEQLAHLIRYIHLNPIASNVIPYKELQTFNWSSHRNYLQRNTTDIIENDIISMVRRLVPDYESFINNQIAYAQELEKIKHMTFEHEQV